MDSPDQEKKIGLSAISNSDKSSDLEKFGSDPEKHSGRDDARGHHHADDDEDDHESDTSNDLDAGEIQPVQSRAQSIINRVLSTVVSTHSINPGPPPDGGWSAWVIGETMNPRTIMPLFQSPRLTKFILPAISDVRTSNCHEFMVNTSVFE
jgi:hypothetical protein